MDFDVMIDRTIDKIGHQPGPMPGLGSNGSAPWEGIVEETPALWVTWVTDAAKRLGRPVPKALLVDGRRVDLDSVRLTYGDRYYFKCPRCGRRVETLFFLGRDFGCRQCMRLGYRSQMHRLGSAYGALDRLFARRAFAGRWHMVEGDPVGALVEDLREGLTEGIRAMLDRVEVVEEGS